MNRLHFIKNRIVVFFERHLGALVTIGIILLLVALGLLITFCYNPGETYNCTTGGIQ